MDGSEALELLDATAAAISAALDATDDWGLAGTRPGQYHSDLAADRAALEVLEGAGVGVLSEESGRHHPARPVTVVVDPLDGSTNASRGIPWFATSLCVVDADGPLAALVVNLASGARFDAVRGGGARVDGRELRPTGCAELSAAVVALSGLPPGWLGWKQYRALGACALDLCAVAGGVVDAYIDCSKSAHGPWDYLGGLLVCAEAGAVVVDAEGRDLVVLDHDARRTPVGAATAGLLDEAVAARRSFL
ncbi:MAG: inositol monophosphatase [Acidimicrobiia bacterium]|nr:inositol monophosphatase [Acidimicrobiia bacterium]